MSKKKNFRRSDVDWWAMANTDDMDPGDHDSILKNLRSIRQIARFNSLIISDQDPEETLSLGEEDPVIQDEGLSLGGGESGDPLEGGSWGGLKKLRLIGVGMHSRVYRAVDPRLDREVALKIYSQESDASRRSGETVIREARLMARVKHPNVMTVYGAERDDRGRVGIWMDYVQGKTLTSVLKEQGTLSAREAGRVGLELCAALAAVHGAGLVHQDIKAQNVMRERGGRIVLMDFGVGRETGEEFIGQATGTPLYMAPEVLTRGEVSVASDIYSLGVLLFHLVTGRFPVEAEGLTGLLEKHGKGQRHLLRDLRSDLSPSFIDVVERALHTDPQKRFASMGNMESALSESLIGRRGATWLSAWMGRRGKFRPVLLSLLLLTSIMIAIWPGSRLFPGEAKISSLAVLPFENMMGDPEQDYFVEGLHDALITELSKLGGLRVISRDSAKNLHESGKSVPEIARALDVDALIMGSVLRVDDRVRINVRLVSGAGEEHLWGEGYDRNLSDILTLLGEVTNSIADEINLAFTPVKQPPRRQVRSVEPEVYEKYLRGQYHLDEFSWNGVLEAFEFFEEAIEGDPSFAPAYVGMTTAYVLGSILLNRPPHEFHAPALECARRAVELDPDLSDAHSSLGGVELYFNRDWDAAERAMRRALELNPNDSNALNDMAVLNVVNGRFVEALELARKTRQLDPYSHLKQLSVWNQLLLSRKYEELIEDVGNWREFTQSDCVDWQYMCAAYTYLGQDDKAMDELRYSWMGSDPESSSILEKAYAESGIQGAYLAIAEDMVAYYQHNYTKPYLIALFFARGGDAEQTFIWLEEMYEDRVSTYFMLAAQAFDPYRSDPRFEDLIKRFGIPEGAWRDLQVL